MSEAILQVSNLKKNYGSFAAVKGISFQIPKGKIIGLLGPNGAGKTTTIHMLMNLVLPTSGEIKYFGKKFSGHREEILQKINYASAYNTLQGRITVLENLLVFARLYQVKDPKEKILRLLEYFEISHLSNQRFWDLSSGEKTRTILIKSLLNDPQLILMDEPTASLDPDIADKMLSLIEELRAERELSILYTSHDMHEVTRVCDEVIFLDKGNIVAQDTPLGLTKRVGSATLNLTFDGEKEKMKVLLEKEKQKFEFFGKNGVSIKTDEKTIPKLIFSISNHGVWITDIEVKKPTLEDVFLKIARGKDS